MPKPTTVQLALPGFAPTFIGRLRRGRRMIYKMGDDYLAHKAAVCSALEIELGRPPQDSEIWPRMNIARRTFYNWEKRTAARQMNLAGAVVELAGTAERKAG